MNDMTTAGAAKRGRDGGYQATDAGLSFIGEDVAAFVVAEAQASERRTNEAKEARKASAKQSQEALKAQLQSELDAA